MACMACMATSSAGDGAQGGMATGTVCVVAQCGMMTGSTGCQRGTVLIVTASVGGHRGSPLSVSACGVAVPLLGVAMQDVCVPTGGFDSNVTESGLGGAPAFKIPGTSGLAPRFTSSVIPCGASAATPGARIGDDFGDNASAAMAAHGAIGPVLPMPWAVAMAVLLGDTERLGGPGMPTGEGLLPATFGLCAVGL